MKRSIQTRAPANARGFTLLEAIVAMVIMASALLALYSWLSASTLSLNRARAQALALDDARSALELMDTINPSREPRGEVRLDALDIRWQTRSTSDLRPGMSSVGFPTQFDFQLHDLDVEVLRDGRLVRSFTIRKTGWVVARPINLDEE